MLEKCSGKAPKGNPLEKPKEDLMNEYMNKNREKKTSLRSRDVNHGPPLTQLSLFRSNALVMSIFLHNNRFIEDARSRMGLSLKRQPPLLVTPWLER